MTIEISSLPDERLFVQYINARNGPKHVMENGVHPNNHRALELYDELTALLAPGGDLEGMATYHTNTISTVLTFVQTMQACMQAINGTMHVVNLLAMATGKTRFLLFRQKILTCPPTLTCWTMRLPRCRRPRQPR